jgi:hypothetical protein
VYVTIAVSVVLDADHLHHQAERRGVPVNVVSDELTAAIEGRLHDEIRWMDGVANVGVSSLTAAPVRALAG